MRPSSPFFVALICLSSTTACHPRKFNTGSAPKLVGGGEPGNEEFRSVAFLRLDGINGCTVARVAENYLLTAAHCVINLGEPALELASQLLPGATPTLRLVGGGTIEVRVEKTMPFAGVSLGDLKELHIAQAGPDVALVRVSGLPNTTQMAITPVDFETQKSGQEVILGGFGCREGADVDSDQGEHEYAFREKQKLMSPLEAVRIPGVKAKLATHSGWRDSEWNYTARAHFVTLGPATGGEAALCPGDSGGPVFVRHGDKSLHVVGVNSSMAFPEGDESMRAAMSFHARLDANGPFAVGQWIAAVLKGSDPAKVVGVPLGSAIIKPHPRDFSLNLGLMSVNNDIASPYTELTMEFIPFGTEIPAVKEASLVGEPIAVDNNTLTIKSPLRAMNSIMLNFQPDVQGAVVLRRK